MTKKRRYIRLLRTAFLVAGGSLAVGALLNVPRDVSAARAAAPGNTAVPTISGVPRVGSTLTTSNGGWSGSPSSYTYLWNRCDSNGNNCGSLGATSSSYQLQSGDLGHTIRVTVTATNADGSTGATSAPTAVVTNPPVNTALPSLSGTPQVGSTVSTSNGSWSGSPTSYAYLWNRCDTSGLNCSALSAHSSTYEVQPDDAGHTLRATVTASSSQGSTDATSAPTAVVTLEGAPANTALPVISGVAVVGASLSVTTGAWSGHPTSYEYAWNRCDANGNQCGALSAGGNAYKLQSADLGHTLRVTVTAKNGQGSGTAVSAPTATVTNHGGPTNTVLPAIAGSPQLGSVLSATTGTWTDNPSSYTYRWNRCDSRGAQCGALSATDSTYRVASADLGHTLRVSVTAKSSLGSTTAISVPTRLIGGTAAVSSGCPAGTGVIQIAQLSQPARLKITHQALVPRVVTRSTQTVQMRFQVTACGGRPVQGAVFFATPVPYNQFSVGRGTTDATGFVVMAMRRLAGYPASARQRRLAVFARAVKPGDPALGGISTRRLVTFPVRLH